tara:strand:- start:19565 stop:20155 length:591 start_codon:yes stop_codon:yes gene_type:complete
MSFLLGLTGSIGMGKSTTAQMFRDEGIPVWDADAAVHKIYAKGGAAVPVFADRYPEVVTNGAVSRPALRALIAAKPDVLREIEQIVHPFVADDRKAFLARHSDALLVFDIPLLFETKADLWLNAVAVVTAPLDVQRARVLDRPEMTQAQFNLIISKQMPDAEKRALADYVIETVSMDAARLCVQHIIDKLKGQPIA